MDSVVFGVVFLLGCYFLPTLVGIALSKRNLHAIFTLNLLLGWTSVGWVVALARAVSVEPAPRIIDLQPLGDQPIYTLVPIAWTCPKCRAPIGDSEVECPRCLEAGPNIGYRPLKP